LLLIGIGSPSVIALTLPECLGWKHLGSSAAAIPQPQSGGTSLVGLPELTLGSRCSGTRTRFFNCNPRDFLWDHPSLAWSSAPL